LGSFMGIRTGNIRIGGYRLGVPGAAQGLDQVGVTLAEQRVDFSVQRNHP